MRISKKKLKNFFKDHWPYITIILLVCLFFWKFFLKGLVPLPADLVVGGYHPWLDYNWGYEVGVPVKNPKLSDAVSIFYPLKELAANQVRNGELPLWNPHMFGGYPLFTNPTLGLLFPTSLLYFLVSTPLAWTLQTMFQPFLGSLFMYIFLRYLKLKKTASFFGGVVYGFGGFSILWLQWNTQATTSLFLPLLLLFFDKYLKTKDSKWGIALSLSVFTQILAGYLPIISLTFACLAFWYLYFSKNKIKDLKIFFHIFLGICLSGFFLLPLGELVLLSQRTSETLGSDSPFTLLQNLVTFIAPDFFGNDATYNFWGKGDHMDATLYTGVTSLIFSMLAIWKLRNERKVRFAVYLFFIVIILTIKNPIGSFVYNLGVWGGSSITMNRANFIHNFIIALLSAYGITYFERSKYKISIKPALLVLSLLIGLALGLLAYKVILSEPVNFKTIFSFSDQGNSQITHLNIALRNLVWPTLVGLVTTASIIIIRKIKPLHRFAVIIFVLILVTDLFRLGWKFNTFSKPEYIYPDTKISDYLKKFRNDRFVSESEILPANMWVPFGLSSLSGYDSIYPVNAAKLIAVANSGKVDASPQPRWGIINNFSSRILDASNVRFLLVLKKDSNGKVSSEGQISSKHDLTKYNSVFEDRGVVILENKNSLPRSYLTNKVIKASDEETLQLMNDETFAIDKISITNDFEMSPNDDPELVFETDYNPLSNSHTVVDTSANQDAFLVVLDSYYPGWKVFIDNKESTIYRTNYNFRGVFLEKGDHVVEFTYFPKSLKYGLLLSGISLVIVLIMLKVRDTKRHAGA